MLTINPGEAPDNTEIRLGRGWRDQHGLAAQRFLPLTFKLAQAAQLRTHPRNRRLTVNKQQCLTIDQIGVEVLRDVVGRPLI
jgi:hypothetical protein